MNSTGSASPISSRTSSRAVSTRWRSGPGTATAGLQSPGSTPSSPGQVGWRREDGAKTEIAGISGPGRSSLSASGALSVVPVISVLVVHIVILPPGLK